MRVLFFLWMVLLPSAMADSQSSIDGLPPMPVNGIYDPDRWLKGDAIEEVARRIAGAREKGNASLYVVILSEIPDSDAESFALRLGRAWTQENLWGMVLQVPGDDTYPRFLGELNRTSDWTGQQLADFQDAIDRALVEASKRSGWQENALLQVESGTQVMADEFGYLGLVMARIDRNNARARSDRVPEIDGSENESGGVVSMLLIGIPLVLFALVVLGFSWGRKIQEDGDDYYFPETLPRKRFLAPWSGGGNTLIQFVPPADEDDFRRR